MGKTAIAEGLAQKIYQRDVPYKLLDKGGLPAGSHRPGGGHPVPRPI